MSPLALKCCGGTQHAFQVQDLTLRPQVGKNHLTLGYSSHKSSQLMLTFCTVYSTTRRLVWSKATTTILMCLREELSSNLGDTDYLDRKPLTISTTTCRYIPL